MSPPASVSGFVFYHPESKYFRVDKISDDQLAQLAAKRQSQPEEKQRWLATQI
jgi:5-methyltetrahydrofolate--homocysteine methyltransferase